MNLHRGTDTAHKPATLSTDRALGTLKYWMICVAGVAGLLIASQSHRFLPHKLFLDEAIILRFITGELTSDGPSSYGTTGWLYRVTGLGSIPELFPILAYAVFSVTVIIAITWRGIPQLSFPAIGLAAGALLLGGVYLSQYSKEFFVLPLVALLLVARRSPALEVSWVALALLYAGFVRPYWFLVVALYVVFRFLIPRLRSAWLLLPLILMGFAAMIVIFDIVLGSPLTFFRTDINNSLDYDRSTQINDVIAGTGFFSQWMNAAAIMIMMAFPVPMLLSGDPLQLLAGGFLAVCWALVVFRSSRVTGASGPGVIPLAFLISFLMVQTAFEPDFGSYLRHITPQLPLFLAIFSATRRKGLPE